VIAKAMAPVWEANHVWLIFALTALAAAFPPAWAALGTIAFLPASLALIAVVVRGASLAFAGQLEPRSRGARRLRRLFGSASVAAPLLFGMIAGGLARGRVAAPFAFWFGPFQLLVGMLAVALCTALAASFLAVEAQRAGERGVERAFRTRGLYAIGAAAALAGLALLVARSAAPVLLTGLAHRGLPAVLVAGGAFAAALAAFHRGRVRVARAAVALAATGVVWGWGLAQYPRLVGPAVTVTTAAASGAELQAVSVALAAGFVLLAPSLWLLYAAFRRQPIEVTK
jgi:cytochrome d ubiquinol oxidase subunit II